jgi:hypothetical protein
MATLIDITDKIKNETKFIKYGDKTYKVDDRKNTIIKVYSIIDQAAGADVQMIEQVMKELLGKEAAKDFDGLSFEDYMVPFFAVMACVQSKSYEEVEASFRKAE